MAQGDDYVAKVLDALKRAVAEELERKRRLGQYAVVWRDGRAVCIGPDAPIEAGKMSDGMVDLVRSNREQILVLAKRHGVTGVRVFGSMARGDAGPHSDVHLLIEVGANPSAWFPGGSSPIWRNCSGAGYRL